MKITKSQLKRIIKEELEAVLAEQGIDPAEEKCKKQGGTYRVKPGTDQMECVLPRGLEEDLKSVLAEADGAMSLAKATEDAMHDVRAAMEMLRKGDTPGAMRALDYVQADLWQIAQRADELENKKPPCPPMT